MNNLMPNVPNFNYVRIKIVEQPAARGQRFRYVGERKVTRSRPINREVSIQGASSTPTNFTFPTVEIEGYCGKVKIVVSCVTKDQPYRSHPNRLEGEWCKFGVCTVIVNGPPMRVVFDSLKIRRVQMKHVEEALMERYNLKVHPFGTNFEHTNSLNRAELKSVRLCFQCFIDIEGTLHEITPVVSEPIYNTEKSSSNLAILRLCSYSAKASGGCTLFLFCQDISKSDIKVRFYEERNNALYWEDFGIFQENDVHKEGAIALRTPPYKDPNIQKEVEVFIQLYRPSDGKKGEPRGFMFYPDKIKRKRVDMKLLLESLQDQELHIDENATNLDSATERKLRLIMLLMASSENTKDLVKSKHCNSEWNQQQPECVTETFTSTPGKCQQRPISDEFPNDGAFTTGINQQPSRNLPLQWNVMENDFGPIQSETLEQNEISHNHGRFGSASNESQGARSLPNCEEQNMASSNFPFHCSSASPKKPKLNHFGSESLIPADNNSINQMSNNMPTMGAHGTQQLNLMLSPKPWTNEANNSDNIMNNFSSNSSQDIENNVYLNSKFEQWKNLNFTTDSANANKCLVNDVDYDTGYNNSSTKENVSPQMVNQYRDFTDNFTNNYYTPNITQFPDTIASNNIPCETTEYENIQTNGLSNPHESTNLSEFAHNIEATNNFSSYTSQPQTIESANILGISNASEPHTFENSNNIDDSDLNLFLSELDSFDLDNIK